ncbi:MAG: beta-lactamase family protein [Pseudomonadales bacterium]|nr:beta-lactamase family protein [Pseudomonadales bacterium]
MDNQISPPINGTTSTQFSSVKNTFADLWREIEIGASLCVFYKGQKVIDLWGGFSDKKMQFEWQADTLVNIYSTGKGMASLAFAILVDQGHVQYTDQVCKYWPEFGAENKQDTTISQLLSHQAGLCGIQQDLTVEDLYDWNKMANLIAAQKPLWLPGKNSGYHAITWGFFPGELIRRISGFTLREFFAQQVTRPLDVDCYFGLPKIEYYRCAELIGPNHARKKPPLAPTGNAPLPAFHQIALLNPAISPFKDACSQAFRAAELAASNGHSNARSLAKIYAALSLGGTLNHTTIISSEGLKAATEVQVEDTMDLVTGTIIRRSNGFILNSDQCYGPNADAFGHAGAGGSMAFADPGSQLGFAYTMNQMHVNSSIQPRAKQLIDAVYRCL